MEKALNSQMEDVHRKHVLIDGNVFCQKALSLREDCSKGFSEMSGIEAFTASVGQLCRFRNGLGLKNMKFTGGATSAEEEAAATFLARAEEVDSGERTHAKTGVFLKNHFSFI